MGGRWGLYGEGRKRISSGPAFVTAGLVLWCAGWIRFGIIAIAAGWFWGLLAACCTLVAAFALVAAAGALIAAGGIFLAAGCSRDLGGGECGHGEAEGKDG